MNIRQKHIVLLLFATFISAAVFAQVPPTDSLIYQTSCNSYLKSPLFFANPVKQNKQRHTFNETTLLYCSPDTSSQVLDTLPFNTPVRLQELVTIYTADTSYQTEYLQQTNRHPTIRKKLIGQFYKITYRQQTGYIKMSGLANEDLVHRGFLAGPGVADGRSTIIIKSFDKEAPSVIKHVYGFEYLSHGHNLMFPIYNGLKDSGKLIRYRTYRQSCPGANLNEFVIYNQNGFTKLLSGFSTGEAGEFEYETIYLPMKFPNDKVLLVANADLENILNYQTGGLHVYDYPKHLNVPIDQLIVKTREYTEPILDKDGEYVMVDDYEVKVKVIKEKPKFYKWDGRKLTEVK
ncbi:MAG TPA: hypothetical protein VK927_00680 [Adhaeribacter sp.]|nr:hypothetical protein [Adhaeribacter sp.]